MMKIPPVKVYFSELDKKEILAKIDESLTSGMLTLNKYGKEFEQTFLQYVGTEHAISVNSGTSALEIPLRSWLWRTSTGRR